jgi:hypothetical protein
VSEQRVRYHSPFARTAWLPVWQARSYLAQDDARWMKLEELGMISTRQRSAGRPGIAAAPAIGCEPTTA